MALAAFGSPSSGQRRSWGVSFARWEELHPISDVLIPAADFRAWRGRE